MQEINILVTGGAGFIGSHLVEKLLETGNEVTVLDDLSAGSEKNLRAAAKFSRLNLVKGDVRNARIVEALVKKVDCVYHMAVKTLVLSLEQPRVVHEVNDTGTFNVCMAARQSRITRLIYVSSSEVYGTAQYAPIDEKHPLNPGTPYAAGKAAGEMYVRSFNNVWEIPAVIVRLFNTYGSRARMATYSSVIPNFVERCLAGKPPIIYGDGNQTRDFTYVSDTVDGIVKAANCDDLIGQVVNIARGEEVSVNRIADIVLGLTKVKGNASPMFKEVRPGDTRRQLADISKAKRMLGFKPEVSIEEGIRKYIEWRRRAY